MKNIIEKRFEESVDVIKKSTNLSNDIEKAVKMICDSVRNGHKIYLFGNGGSAADAQHIAAELIGRYKIERKSIPAISLTTDTSILTSISNDYSFDNSFSRQCEGLVNENDVIMAISTSGNSKNVIEGLMSAKNKQAKTIGLLGNKGNLMENIVDIPIIVDSNSTDRIQEVHRIIYHIICELVEKELSANQ
jgi:D-sedoheptulose 7-phosphate isomerase